VNRSICGGFVEALDGQTKGFFVLGCASRLNGVFDAGADLAANCLVSLCCFRVGDDALFLRFDICHTARLTAGEALPNMSRVEFAEISRAVRA
jgi:hypothetical protein